MALPSAVCPTVCETLNYCDNRRPAVWRAADELVQVELVGNYRRSEGKVHNTILDTYTVSFRTNTRLPEFVGLGKGAARGFGALGKLSQ